MKTKSTIWIISLMTISVALVMLSFVSKNDNQPVFATLLEGNLQMDKNNLGGNLMKVAEICNNNTDDNGNGLVDANDPDCAKTPLTPEICNNNTDDNGNGLVDANDPDCAKPTQTTEQEQQQIQQLDTNRPDLLLNDGISKENINTSQSLQNSNTQVAKKQSDMVMQSINDDKLVERIFPLIVKKLDGPTILKKVDGLQLLQKLDRDQLLKKILPYVKIVVKPVTQPSSTRISKSCPVGDCGGDPVINSAKCGPEDGVAVGGTFYYTKSEGDDDLLTQLIGNDEFQVSGTFETSGELQATVLCMKLDALTAPAPGGGPLIPPAE
jgi:hypothetical protein